MGDWGDGSVELIELPTLDETNDNIVANWTPAAPPEPGKPFALRLSDHRRARHAAPRAQWPRCSIHSRRRRARSARPSPPTPDAHRFIVDFAGGDLAYYVNDPAQVEAVATSSNGRVLRTNVVANPHIDGVRAFFDVSVKPGDTSDLRLFLRANGRTLTETWTLPWSPPSAI